VIAKFADPQAIFGADWRPKHAASHRTGFVEFAIPSFRIECGARFIVRKIGETLSGGVSFFQSAAHRIARKISKQPSGRVSRTFAYAISTPGRAQFQIGQPLPQPQNVQLIDRKCADAALCTPGAAHQPLAAAARRFSQCGVDDLNQFLIFDRKIFGKRFGSWRVTRHDDS